MVRIFISYRRGDTAAYARRLYDALVERFGDDQVSMDIDAIEPGVDFVERVEHAVDSCDVFISLIGPDWLTVSDSRGGRRVDDPADFVRREIEAALDRHVRLIPVLVQGAEMPPGDELPAPLAPLARRNALQIRDTTWHEDVRRLIATLEKVEGTAARYEADERPSSRPPRPQRAPAGPRKRARVRVPDFSFSWRPLRRRSVASPQLSFAQLVAKRDDGLSEVVGIPFDLGAGSADEHPAAPDEDIVDCTVFAPPHAARGEAVFVQVFAHLLDQAEEVQTLAEEFDADTERRAFKTLGAIVRHGDTLDFNLQIPRLTVVDAAQSLIWRGRAESVQFEVEVPKDARLGTNIGTVTISVGSVPIGHVKFKLSIVAQRQHPAEPSEPVGDDVKRYTSAFVSYSSKDRRKVLERVQMLKPVGIRYFQDLLDLDPGDRWEQKLYLNIGQCDLFLLFWSSDAKASPWVRKEVRYALDRKGSDEFAAPEIRPVIIEGPPIPPPWPELAHLHFGDSLVYLTAGLQS
jgi:hypothetical protein